MSKMKRYLKRIFPFVLAVTMFLVPFSNFRAFAYTGGLLNGVTMTTGGILGSTFYPNSTTSAVTDNNLGSSYRTTDSSIWYHFNSPVSISSLEYLAGSNSDSSFSITFLDSNKNSVFSYTASKSLTTKTVNFSVVNNVSYVIMTANSAAIDYIYEFDVFGPAPATHTEISGLTVTQSGTSENINYAIPSGNADYTGSKIYRDGVLIATQNINATSFIDTGLNYNSAHTYKVTATYNDGFETTGVSKQINVVEPHDEISNLGATVSYSSANLTWSLPNNQFLVGFKIYRNGTLIKTLNTVENYYTDDGLNSGTNYTYKITSLYDDGYETSGVSKSFTTNTKPHDEVSNVDATVSFDSSVISWSIPDNQFLTGFNVYRDNVLVGTMKKTDTYFQDSGLNESTVYQYKITSTYDDGYETAGVSITATTTSKPHDEVGNLTVSTSYNSTTLAWSKPDIPYLLGFNVYRDNQLIKTLDLDVTTYEDDGLEQGTTYNYKIISVYNDGYVTQGALIKATTKTKPHDEITNLNADMTYNSAKLSWTIPDNQFLVGFNVYRDDQLIKSLDKSTNSYDDSGLTELTSYNYKIVSLYDDNFVTEGVSNTFTTTEDTVIKQVSSAKAEAVSYKQVNLSWSLPNQHIFHHVNIYRAVEPKKQGILQSLLGTVAFADTTPTEIFETNGTYFNDLTVQPDTSYQYTLTSESTDGTASDPVMVSAQTPVEPTPVYTSNGTYSVNQDGNYVFKWDQPTTGTVKIQIDGQDYKTVDASQQQIAIPKSDMKTTIWGDPNVSAIPVGEFGTTGKTVALGGDSFQSALSMPIQSNDLLTTIMGLVGIVAPILLLVLVILYFKPIKRIIEKAALHRKTRRGK